MTNRFPGFAARVASAVASVALLCLPAQVFGQSKGGNYTPSKTWFNQPDLMGIWEPAKPINNIEKGGYIKDPSNGKIPYLPAATAKRDENAKGEKTADLVNRCYFPGVPRLMYMGYPFQIFETEKYVAVVSEYAHVYRMIYLDGSEHIDFPGGFWLGDSRGHFEGNTLVSDVTGFNDQTWLDKAGNYHSDQLHVVERFTRTGPHSLLYEATISDPKTFSKEWKISIPMNQKTGPTARIMEYECQDLAFGK